MIRLFNNDSLILLKKATSNSVDSIVTDPPYGISFMGKGWDKVLPPTEIWQECLRVLKPGGYLVAMSASRTYHRLAVQLEDLGMICHPMIGWIYGSGFPKATDLSKQFDKGIEREVIGTNENHRADKDGKIHSTNTMCGEPHSGNGDITAPSTDLAKKWVGYKYGLQSLKPALEPIAVFQKPWKCKGVKKMTENVVKHGVGAFNIDACRVDTSENLNGGAYSQGDYSTDKTVYRLGTKRLSGEYKQPQGRHPANLLHDGSEVVEQVFKDQSDDMGMHSAGSARVKDVESSYNASSYHATKTRQMNRTGDSGSASRFFNNLPITDLDVPFLYTAKPSKRERNQGLEGMEKKDPPGSKRSKPAPGRKSALGEARANHHPTVKPIALMNWLVKLVTPEGGTILDPFMGSGTTGIAAKEFNFIGIELDKDYLEIAKKRINGQ